MLTSTPPNPDNLLLRLLVWLAFAGLAAGLILCTGLPCLGGEAGAMCALILAGLVALAAHFRGRGFWFGVCLAGMAGTLALGCGLTGGFKGHEVAGRNTLLAALPLGLLFGLAYLTEILLRRVQVRLLEWLACVGVLGGVLALLMGWSGGGRVGIGSGNLPLLMAASAMLLLRGMVLARTSVRWLPEGLARDFPALRSGRTSLVAPPAESPIWVVLLYLLSPFAWWLGAVSFLQVWLWREAASPSYALAALVTLLLMVRILLGAWVWFAAWTEGRQAEREDKRPARWFLFSGGLAPAGLLALYAFVFATTRVQQEAVAKVLAEDEARHVAALRDMQPSPFEEDQDAMPHYARAESLMPAISNYAIFYDQWETPDGAALIRDGIPAGMEILKAAALPQCQFFEDYGMDPLEWRKNSTLLSRDLINMLMLDARFAAAEGRWTRVLAQARTAFAVTRHMRQSPDLISVMISDSCEEIVLLTLLAPLLGTAEHWPDQAVMKEMQDLIQDAEAQRGKAIVRSLRFMNHQAMRTHARNLMTSGTSWPGDIAPEAMLRGQAAIKRVPLKNIETWNESLALQIEIGEMKSAMAMLNQHQSPSSMLRSAWLFCGDTSFIHARTLEADLDIVAEYRLADAALGAMRHRKVCGRWPASLNACASRFLRRVPYDPYAPDSPVRFEDNPPRVYSAGLDGKYAPAEHASSTACSWEMNTYLQYGGYDDRVLHLSLDPSPQTYREETQHILLATEVKALNSANPLAKRMALRNLTALGPKAKLAVPDLLMLAGDPLPDFRTWAAFLLGKIGSSQPQVLSTLESLAQDPDRFVRYFARRSLRSLRPVNLADRP